MILFGLGLAIGVVLAVGALLFFQVSLDINTILFSRCNSFLSFQLRSIVRNQTGIEEWIMEKADYRLRDSDEKFVNPYDLVRTECLFFFFCIIRLCYVFIHVVSRDAGATSALWFVLPATPPGTA